MKILGITGGVGAGKSTVLSYIEEKYGARVIQADAVGHLLQRPGGACYAQIIEAFGSDIQNSDGTLNREKLGAAVYQDRARLAQLNAIVHPAVKAWIAREIAAERERRAAPFVVIEAALLLEDHYEQVCDEIWYLYADIQTRIRRLENSRGYSAEKARRIMKNQMSDAEFRRRCRVVIDNSGDMAHTCAQIDRALREFVDSGNHHI